jgi:hypothetical protein
MAVSAVLAQSVVCLSLKLRVRVSFTVETAVPPFEARGDGSGALCWRERFKIGSSQPKPWTGRRKHIADGPEGAASRGASKAKVDPRIRAAARGVKWEGPRLACPKPQPRSGDSASFAEAHGVIGAGRRAGGSVSGLGQANRSPGRDGGSTSQMAQREQRAGARARQRLPQESTLQHEA